MTYRLLLICLLAAGLLPGRAGWGQALVPVFQTGHEQNVTFTDVNPGLHLLLTADKTSVALWNTQTGQQLRVLTFPYQVTGAVFCRNGREVAVSQYDVEKEASVQFYDAATGQQLSRLSFAEKAPPTYESADGFYYPELHLTRDTDGQRLAVTRPGEDSLLYVVQVASRRKSAPLYLPATNNINFYFTAQPNTYLVCYGQVKKRQVCLALLDSTGRVGARATLPGNKVGTAGNRAGDTFYLLAQDLLPTPKSPWTSSLFKVDLALQPRKLVTSAGLVCHSCPFGTYLALSADGTKLLAPGENPAGEQNQNNNCFYSYYDLTSGQETCVPRPQNLGPFFQTLNFAAFYADDNERVLCVSGNQVELVNRATGLSLLTLGNKLGALGRLSFNAAGTVLSAGQPRVSSHLHYSRQLHLGTGESALTDYQVAQWLTDSLALCITRHNELYKVYNARTKRMTEAVQLRNVLKDGTLLPSYGDIPYGKPQQLMREALAKGALFSVPNESQHSIATAGLSADKSLLAYVAHGELYLAAGPTYANPQKCTSALATQAAEHDLLSEHATVSFTSDSRYLVLGLGNGWRIYNVAQQTWQTLPLLDKVGVRWGGPHTYGLTADGQHLLYLDGEWQRGKQYNTYHAWLMSYALATGQSRKVRELPYGSAAVLACHPTRPLYALGLENGTVEVRQLADEAVVYSSKAHNVAVSTLLFQPRHARLLSLGQDNSLVLSDYTTRATTLRLALLQRQPASAATVSEASKAAPLGGFALVTGQNYYLAPPATAAELHYAQGLNTYSFEQFDLRYNRPDKVLQALGSPDTALVRAYRRAYEKRLRRARADTAAWVAGRPGPTLAVANADALPPTQAEPTLRLHLQAADAALPLQRLHLWVNEVPVFGSQGLRMGGRARRQLDTTVVVTLSAGVNRLEASVSNRAGAESYRQPLAVTYTPAQPPPMRVYFVGIGLNRFASAGHDLQWSVKDIRDLTAALRQKYGAALQVDTLLDSRVTATAVAALRTRLLESSVNDKVIVAYSGHGLLSRAYDYYLSTYDVDFRNPAQRGLPYEALDALLDGIPARRKLLLLDACHSGEVDKEARQRRTQAAPALAAAGITSTGTASAAGVTGRGLVEEAGAVPRVGLQNSFELMQQLFANVGRGTGTTVVAAAAGTQLALERNSLRNGVFTACLLELLAARPELTVTELQRELAARVTELTQGQQVPTTRATLLATDWQL